VKSPWAVQIERDHRQIRARSAAKLVDRRPAMLEIGDHLHGHFGRIGADPMHADAVIARKDQRLSRAINRARRGPPSGHEHRDLLQPAQRSRRLGQAVLPGARRIGGGLVERGAFRAKSATSARLANIISLSWAVRRPPDHIVGHGRDR
jgi:multidrug efflux pump subunit AcrA (membrane-fusion protein)